jgi:hypothetical protein
VETIVGRDRRRRRSLPERESLTRQDPDLLELLGEDGLDADADRRSS